MTPMRPSKILASRAEQSRSTEHRARDVSEAPSDSPRGVSGERTAHSLLDLIERLEKAAEPDSDIDYAIGHYLWILGCEPAHCFSYGTDNPGRPFTKSIDVALTLMPDGWRVTQCNEVPRVMGLTTAWIWRVELEDFTHGGTASRAARAGAKIAAIAISTAALKARAALAKAEGRS